LRMLNVGARAHDQCSDDSGQHDQHCLRSPSHRGCYLGRFSKTSLATGSAEKTFGQPA
jgi:hypothetical protein